jgi:hypothetical protein
MTKDHFDLFKQSTVSIDGFDGFGSAQPKPGWLNEKGRVSGIHQRGIDLS